MQFEKDTTAQVDPDPFNIDEMIRESTGGIGGNTGSAGGSAGAKRYGVQEPEGRPSKRARVEDEDG